MWCWSNRGASWARVTLIGLLTAAALFVVILLAYQLALARVPQHRAALERLLRAQTGLDVRFSELGVRWGWYGPEAVFRNVELGEPGRSNIVLRAPELTVGFDAWRTMRSGHLEAGRIALIAPDINLEGVGSESGLGSAPRDTARTVSGRALVGRAASLGFERVQLLERWRDGRIDIEGGTLRLPGPEGSTRPFLAQIRRASVRRSGDEWNLFALMFLPERLGRTARLAMRLAGPLDSPDGLSGSVRFEGRRLSFAGWQEFGSFAPEFARHAPAAGGGDVTLNLDFAHGRIQKADGSLYASGVVLGSPAWSERTLNLDRLRLKWRLVHRDSDWRVRVDELELTHVDLAGVDFSTTARDIAFDWDGRRQAGRRLNASARLENLAVTPPSHGFVLAGLKGLVSGNEDEIAADLYASAARIELAGAPEDPLDAVRIASRLRITRADEGWQLATERLELRHDTALLELTGTLTGGGARLQPELAVRGTLTAAAIPLVGRILGADAPAAFGSASSALTAGRIERAEFELRGPLDELPYGTDTDSFAGSATLRDAVVAGGDQWPEVRGVSARIEWRGALVRAVFDTGQAGPFQLANATAAWRAADSRSLHIAGRVKSRIENALAWMRDRPGLDTLVPHMESLGLEGDSQLDFDVSIPDVGNARSRVVASLEGARLRWVSGAAPVQDLLGSLVFEDGRLQRSTVTGTWVGGPVTLRVDQRRARGQTVLAVRAHGTFDARQLATLEAIDARRVAGSAEWNGEFTYFPASDPEPARWHVRADSSLTGIASELPEPLAKASGESLPLRVDLAGSENGAQLRASLGERLRSVLALQYASEHGWRIERGNINFGASTASLPAEKVVLIQGRVNRLDLPSYLAAWQQTLHDPDAPPIQAQLTAGELVAAGRGFPEVVLAGGRTDAGFQLQMESSTLAGELRWPLAGLGAGAGSRPAEVHLSRLSIPEAGEAADSGSGMAAVLAAVGRTAHLSIDDLVWEGGRVGHLTATLAAREDGVTLDDVRVSGATHDGTGTLSCQSAPPKCRAVFKLESSDAAATLVDFGFRPDLSASRGLVTGDLEWQGRGDPSWAATLSGRLNIKMADGTTRAAASEAGRPFALLSVPALVRAMNPPGADGTPKAPPYDLRFTRLDADFDLDGGQAMTSDLHFDGDAEILMRGRTGLLTRDYDQQVWILKGEERLPAAVRRLGPTPRVAAAWLTLRELFAATGVTQEDPPRATLHLQGTWSDPAVELANR